MAAKLMILTKPSATPPMGQCYVEQRSAGSGSTAFSSLAPSRKTAGADKLCPGFLDETPGSKTDSEATVPMQSFEQWEEHNKMQGLSFDSCKSWACGTSFNVTPKMETGAGEKKQVRRKSSQKNVCVLKDRN